MMSDPDNATRFAILCVDPDRGQLAALARDIERLCGFDLDVETCIDAEQALLLTRKFSKDDTRVAIIFTELELPGAMGGAELLLTLQERPEFRATRKVLASESVEAADLTQLLNRGALHRYLRKPWLMTELRDCVRSLITSYVVHHVPEASERLKHVIDTEQFPRAFRVARQEQWAMKLQMQALKRSFLANIILTDEEVDEAMVAGIDDALNNPPRKTYPPGSVILRQNEPVHTISILLSGHLELSREAKGREVTLHEQSAGRIVGLLSLAHGQRAFYTWTAKTEVTVIPLSLDQLELALQRNPWLSNHLVTSQIRRMVVRSKRTAELLLQVDTLNTDLRKERDNLEDALKRLEESQAQLVESQKMATLGQLSAGVAHELNNPIAAIQRASEYLNKSVVDLLSKAPNGQTIRETIEAALGSGPVSTRLQRQWRAEMAKHVGDADRAQRLVKAGITTPEAYERVFGKLPGKERDLLLKNIEQYHAVGSALRSLASCSERVTAIVKSLRSYTRSDQAPVANVNLNEGIEDTLLIFKHDMKDVKVTKQYGELPLIECRAGEINQVWTNVISNALQAMNHKGTLTIQTDAPEEGFVRVQITDSGPGIPQTNLDRVFELNFTTKQGQVGFGLGLGLTICRQIITRHGGTIKLSSQPGQTCVTVVLPLRCSRLPGEG